MLATPPHLSPLLPVACPTLLPAKPQLPPSLKVDQDGAPLSGANGNLYTWTIDEKSLPPSKYFSSLIIYNLTNKMMPVVPNAPRWR